MTLQHHLQSCGQVWNFGTSQPQHRGVESNGMQGWERRQDMESRPTMQLWHSPASTRALEEFSCRTCQLIQNQPRNSKLFSNVFVYVCVQLFMPHALPYQAICWSGAFQCVCLIRQPLPDILGPCCWPQCLPSFSRLPKYLQISSPQMSNECEWMIMKAIRLQCFFQITPALLGYIPNLSQPNSLTFWTCRFVSGLSKSLVFGPWPLWLAKSKSNASITSGPASATLRPPEANPFFDILLRTKNSMFFTLLFYCKSNRMLC